MHLTTFLIVQILYVIHQHVLRIIHTRPHTHHKTTIGVSTVEQVHLFLLQQHLPSARFRVKTEHFYQLPQEHV